MRGGGLYVLSEVVGCQYMKFCVQWGCGVLLGVDAGQWPRWDELCKEEDLAGLLFVGAY